MADAVDELAELFRVKPIEIGAASEAAWLWKGRWWRGSNGRIQTPYWARFSISSRSYVAAVGYLNDNSEIATNLAVMRLTGMAYSTVRRNLSWLSGAGRWSIGYKASPLIRYKQGREFFYEINTEIPENCLVVPGGGR